MQKRFIANRTYVQGAFEMKLHYFKTWDVIPVVVHITSGLDENGAPIEVATYSGKCNFSEKSKTVRNADGQLIRLDASLSIGCDIAPNVPVITGSVEVLNKNWNIYFGARPRNPDGSVCFTELGLI